MKRQDLNNTDASGDLVRVRQCFDAYGADIAKWPAEKRDRFGALAMSSECASLREEAASLDALLGAATAPQPSADLVNRIAAQFTLPQTVVRAFSLLSFLRPLPAGAFAGLGALGFAVGLMTSAGQAALAPEVEALELVGDITTLTNDEEALPWDAD